MGISYTLSSDALRMFHDSENVKRPAHADPAIALILCARLISYSCAITLYEEHSMSLLSILVVEDDEGLQNLLRRLLSQEGHQVTVVGSGQEAIRVAQEIPVHVLMTDLKLPDIDGLAVLERILQIDSKVIGIVMTGYGSIDCAVKAMKAGAFDFLTKPFDNEVVVGSINKALEALSPPQEHAVVAESRP